MQKNLVVTGPTATGKTKLAVYLARKFGGEIVSADSRQVYKRLDIGTGKDLNEYTTGGEPVPFHQIDIVGPDEEYNLMQFLFDSVPVINDIHGRGKLPVIEGGTPLYIDALVSGYEMKGAPPDKNLRSSLEKLDTDALLELLSEKDSSAYNKLKNLRNRLRIIRAIERADCTDPVPVPPALSEDTQWLLLGVYFHRSEIRSRIAERLEKRLKSGMIEEAKRLHESGLPWERMEFLGLEYRYLAYFLQGKLSYDEMEEQLLIKIRQFAKRQDIWFRKMEREGHVIHWIRHGDKSVAEELVRRFLADEPLPEPELRISEIKYS